MFECLIFGDSIGLGTARAVNERFAPHCEVRAVERATTDQMLTWSIPTKTYGTSILAVGSNDEPTPALAEKLAHIRTTIKTLRVIWLLPYSRTRAAIVRSVAARHGDETLDLTRFRTHDRIHPANYRQLAAALLKPPS